MKTRELFTICKLCNQYKPFYWIRYYYNECYDCKPTKTSNISKIANLPFVIACNPNIKQTILENNKQKVRISRKQYQQRVEVKIAGNIRKRLRKLVKDDGHHYTPETELLIGCNKQDLRAYIQNKFLPNMTWENYGNKENQWSIDHIIPLSCFNLFDNNEIMEANHYTNLQPLWHIDNMKKGSKLL